MTYFLTSFLISSFDILFEEFFDVLFDEYFDKLFDNFFDKFCFSEDFLTMASFRIGVPLILFHIEIDSVQF